MDKAVLSPSNISYRETIKSTSIPLYILVLIFKCIYKIYFREFHYSIGFAMVCCPNHHAISLTIR